MSAVGEELVPVVELGPLRVEDHQGLLHDAEAAVSRGWRKSFGPCHEGPADAPVLVLLQPLVLQGPDVLAQAGCTSLVWVLPVLFVVAQPFFELRFDHPQVGLVWHLLCLGGHFHFHGGPVDKRLRDAHAVQDTLPGIPGGSRTAAVAPRSLRHHRDLAGDHLAVVAVDDATQVGHRAVRHLDGLPIENLVQSVAGWEAGVDEVEELAPDVRFDGV